jgi:hypothetical protein
MTTPPPDDEGTANPAGAELVTHVRTWYWSDIDGASYETNAILASIRTRRRVARWRRAFGVAVAACALFGSWLLARHVGRAVLARDLRRPSVRFVYVAAGSVSRVALVGDFNGWDPRATPLVRSGDTWVADVPVPAGPHSYAFILDDHRWTTDPAAPLAPDDGLGPTSILVVPPRRSQ